MPMTSLPPILGYIKPTPDRQDYQGYSSRNSYNPLQSPVKKIHAGQAENGYYYQDADDNF